MQDTTTPTIFQHEASPDSCELFRIRAVAPKYLGIDLLEVQVLLLHLLEAVLQLSLQLVLLSQDTLDFLCSICTSSKGGSFQSLKDIKRYQDIQGKWCSLNNLQPQH